MYEGGVGINFFMLCVLVFIGWFYLVIVSIINGYVGYCLGFLKLLNIVVRIF